MKSAIATVAIAGSIAALVLLNAPVQNESTTFLSKDVTEEEREFLHFIAKNHRSYASKDVFKQRLAIFA